MRRFLVFATIIVFLVTAALFMGGLVLAQAAPLRPGDTLFAFQRFAEQERLWITTGKAERADYLIRIAERRVVDLIQNPVAAVLCRLFSEPSSVFGEWT